VFGRRSGRGRLAAGELQRWLITLVAVTAEIGVLPATTHPSATPYRAALVWRRCPMQRCRPRSRSALLLMRAGAEADRVAVRIHHGHGSDTVRCVDRRRQVVARGGALRVDAVDIFDPDEASAGRASSDS
jgi:hypothetical protein